MTHSIQHLNSPSFLKLGLPFSEIVRVDDMLYLSGQMGTVTGEIRLVEGGMREQALQAMKNIQAALEFHGYTMQHIVKCTVMLSDMSEWGAFNEVYKSFFRAPYPARSAFESPGLALGGKLEIEAIATVGNGPFKPLDTAAAQPSPAPSPADSTWDKA